MLTNNEIIDIIKIIRSTENEDEIYALKEKILLEFLPTIKKIAYDYKNSILDYEDIIQESSLALIDAINNFNLKKNITFEEFLIKTINSKIKELLKAQEELDEIPKYISNTLNKILSAEEKLPRILKRKPKNIDVCLHLDIEKSEYDEMKSYALTSLGLDNKYLTDEYLVSDLVNMVSKTSEDSSYDNELIETLELSLDTLSPFEKELVIKHFGLYGNETMSIEDLSIEYNMSYEKLRQQINQIIRKIRMEMTE